MSSQIIYAVPEIIPDSRARFVQILNTCHALAVAGEQVVLAVGVRRGFDGSDLLGFYDLAPHPNLRILKLPVMRREKGRGLFSWHVPFHVALLAFLLALKSEARTRTVLFVRHLKLGKFLLSCRWLHHLPIVFEVHELFHRGIERADRRSAMLAVEQKVYKGADRLVCISSALADAVRKLGIDTPASVVHDSVRNEWFTPCRTVLSGPICYTGSLYRWKGVDTLIQAMKHLPDCQLVVVGGGDRLQELKQLARDEGVESRVAFIGAVSHNEVPQFLDQAGVAVLPNISDGPSEYSSPLKLFEYMAKGLPIVASDLPAFREVLKDMNNAVLVPPGDSKALAEGILKVIMDERLSMFIAGNAYADAYNYTYTSRAMQIMSVVDSCLY